MDTRTKFPKTFHFPWSENLQNDDRMLPSISCFEGKEVVVTEKLDGENTTMSDSYCHARSLDSQNHPSRNWVRGLWGQVRWQIPITMRVCGENMYAEHSIRYEKLTSFFYTFSIFETMEGRDVCLSWDDTVKWCQMFGLQTVPVIYRGPFDVEKIKACYTGKSAFDCEQEGYVVRNTKSFLYNEFQNNVAKFVRKNHVQTDEFWMKTWKPNKLKG